MNAGSDLLWNSQSNASAPVMKFQNMRYYKIPGFDFPDWGLRLRPENLAICSCHASLPARKYRLRTVLDTHSFCFRNGTQHCSLVLVGFNCDCGFTMLLCIFTKDAFHTSVRCISKVLYILQNTPQ